MDILVLATMKNAAKCDTQCELQNSVNHQNFERILRSEVFLRACLSQWHLPLSHPGFSRASLVREEGELRHSPGCCVAPSAELARSVTLCMSADAQRGSRCLLRHSLPIADVLVFDVCRPLERAVFPAIDSKSRDGCVCWGIYVYVSWHGALSLSFESCPEIKQGYPLNLSI